MDWLQTLVIIGVFSGFFVYMLSKLDGLRKDIQSLDRRIQTIENRLEFSNKVVYVQHKETKEN